MQNPFICAGNLKQMCPSGCQVTHFSLYFCRHALKAGMQDSRQSAALGSRQQRQILVTAMPFYISWLLLANKVADECSAHLRSQKVSLRTCSFCVGSMWPEWLKNA
eukprot:scaffold395191_cov37-Prasinocladus_malaysianus.AAC.1